MVPVAITACSLVTALGGGTAANWAALARGQCGLRPCDLAGVGLATWIGRVAGLEQVRLPAELLDFDCRNNRLALLGLDTDELAQRVAAARSRYGADRIGVFLGTSTSGMSAAEQAYAARDPVNDRLPEDFRYATTQNLDSLTAFCRRFLGLRGPSFTLSTACSSSAKVFAAAARMLALGLCDAALVGGVDSLCLTTLYGFASLELLAPGPCAPWDAHRQGISISEAAGFALLEREGAEFALLGYGESADAHHMSTPHPEGTGAALAMRRALARAGLDAGAIDYVNLHGTGTRLNDCSEDRAMLQVFSRPVAASSTKGWTGHTLGACGAVEALVTLLALRRSWLPPCRFVTGPDPALATPVLTAGRTQRVSYAMSNSFGFGGNNCSLIFGRTP